MAYYAARGEGVPKVGYLLIVLLAGKMALSMLSKPVRVGGHPDVTVSAAVPFYNEDPATLFRANPDVDLYASAIAARFPRLVSNRATV